MKTKLTSIALTLAGVTIFGLGLANSSSGNAFAKINGNPSIEQARISDENLSNTEDSTRKCCDLDPLDASINSDANLKNEEVRSDDNGVQSDDNGVRSDDNGLRSDDNGPRSNDNGLRSGGNDEVRSYAKDNLNQKYVADENSRNENVEDAQSNFWHNNPQN